MAEKGKGSFGYLKKQAVKQGIFALVNVAICAVIFCIGFFLVTKSSTIFTVVSVLGMLPAAKFIVSMILFMRAEKYSCSKADYDETVNLAGDKKNELLCGFDFYLTSYVRNFPLNIVLVRKGSLIAYTSAVKCDCNKAKEHLEEYMKKNNISGINVKVFPERDKFFDRFGQLCDEDLEVTENEKALYGLVCNLSL